MYRGSTEVSSIELTVAAQPTTDFENNSRLSKPDIQLNDLDIISPISSCCTPKEKEKKTLVEVGWVGLWVGLLSSAGWMKLLTSCLELVRNNSNVFVFGDDVG